MNPPWPSDVNDPASPARLSRHVFRLAALPQHLVLALLVLGTFLPVLRHDFINYDDELYVTKNAHVQGGLTWDGVKWAFTSTTSGNWHPLTWLSHMLDCQFFGPQVWGHHLTSVLLHTAATLMLFQVLRRMTGATWRSFFVAALFGLHPLRVESVAWIAERKDVLSALVWMLTLSAWSKYADASARRSPKAISHYAAAFVWFAAGLMCKPMLVTLPFVLLMLDWWPLRRIASCQTQLDRSLRISPGHSPPLSLGYSLLEKTPFFLLAAAASVLTWRIQLHEGYVMASANFPFSGRFENALMAYWRYLGKLFWPVKLSVFYPLRDHWPLGVVLVAGLFLLAISMLVLILRARRPHLLVGWFWFLGMLVPVIGLVQAGDQSMADRYTYLPSIGVFLALVWAAHELTRARRHRAVLVSAAAAIVLLCAGLARHQLGYWQDSLTLFTRAHQLTGDSYVVNKCLGAALVADGRPEEAIAPLENNVASEPADAQARLDLGIALARSDRRSEAILQLKEAVRLNPNLAEAQANLGAALCENGALDEGVRHLETALQLNPNNASTHRNLGIALLSSGKRDEAIRHFRRALELQPNFPEVEQTLRSLTNSAPR